MPLEPGQSLSHYRIDRKIGEGGMGEVYLAEDTKLKRPVALKVLPEAMAGDPTRLARFEREAQAVAALNHPHIVTIYSVEEAAATGGAGQGRVHFLTMELIEGESLDRSLPAGGMPLPRVFDVGIALADALAAAHEKGIVHRDLKPANVMATADDRIKVLDFGLARLMAEPTGEEAETRAATQGTPLTGAGVVMGTVPYMSPEQLKGTEVDHRTDIFSLGVMLYELSTGRRPFQGDGSAELISSIMRDVPRPVTELREDVPRHLGRIIAHCLEKDPEARFQTAKDVRNELRSLRKEVDSGASMMTSAQTAVPAAAPARNRWLLPAILGVAAVAVIAFVITMMRGGATEPPVEGLAPAPPAAAVSLRRSVAVLGFKNLAGREDVAWLSTALSEMLTTELAAGGELRTVPGENIAEMKRNLSLREGDTYSPETLAKIRGQLGSDFVVLGSFLTLGDASGGQIRLDLRLQDTDAGETVASLSETGTEASLLDLVGRAGARLREALGAAATTAEERKALRATMPSDPEAARAYHEGLEALRHLEHREARDRLQAAADREPEHPMIRRALSEAWAGLGYSARALAEAETAFQHSGGLPERQRLEVEGRYRTQQHDYERAIEVYRTVWESAPDDLDAGLRLVAAQSWNHAEDALETLQALRSLPEPLGSDPRIGIAESLTLDDLGRLEDSVAAAKRAEAQAADRDAPLLRASALSRQAWVLDSLGQKAEAQAMGREAVEIFHDARIRSLEADALNILAGSLLDPHEAIALYEQCLAIFQEIGNREGEAVILNNMAIELGTLGRLDQQRQMYERALELYRETGHKRNLAILTGNLAANTAQGGDLDAAERYTQEVLEMTREVGARAEEGVALRGLALNRMARARLVESRQLFDESLEIAIETGARPRQASVMGWLSNIERLEDRPDRARELLDEVLAMREEMGLPGAGSRRALGRLELEEGRPGRAEALVRQAREESRSPNGKHSATALLGRALAEQGRAQDAEAEIRAALEATRESQYFVTRINVGMDAAKAEIALGRPDDARRRLEAIREEAAEIGWVVPEVEARLLLARLTLGAGDATAGRAALKAVEEDARALGLKRFARLAAEAAASR